MSLSETPQQERLLAFLLQEKKDFTLLGQAPFSKPSLISLGPPGSMGLTWVAVPAKPTGCGKGWRRSPIQCLWRAGVF